ncbi:hypothetical protein [Proteiniclasticum sp. QWL-01]|uniref:hypothetical protein n=1 Tax=Proteiniclasticum sp. QWL-01 TaxID=3036945 RepID=UPI0024104174|nr:hypothetical protein [Proteiniclasticum sp. QWL-01]WFF72916.1 hypothetical protein P6M73_00110 [Proteiniclasticum sp. QWL-01]
MDRTKRRLKIGKITLLVLLALLIAGDVWNHMKPAATLLDLTGMNASEIVKIELYNGHKLVNAIEDEASKSEVINYLQQSKFKYSSARPKGYFGFPYEMIFYSSKSKSGFCLCRNQSSYSSQPCLSVNRRI